MRAVLCLIQFVLEDIYLNSSENFGGLVDKDWERSIFATAQLTYKDKVTVEGSYRDDWYRAFTQFQGMSPHFAYFSAGANARLSNIFELPRQINELKVRASYSEVGNSVPNMLLLASSKQGIELTASYVLAPNRNFSWVTNVNYAFNDNKIITVARKQNGQPYIYEVDMGNLSGLKVKFKEGGSYGDLYAVGFMTDDITGEVIVDEEGNPFKKNGQANEYLGNMNAKHTLGWANTFTYKDFQFYFLIDGKIGGKVISFTEAYLDYFGTSERTGQARDNAIANNLYWTSEDGTVSKPGMYIPGTTQIVPIESYYTTIGGGTPIGRNYVYDATNFRLREVSIGYTFRNLFGAGKNLTLSANARNLFFLYKDAPIDPETSLSTQNALGNVDIFSMPTTRSYGLTVKATF